MRTVLFTPAARTEMIHAQDWYEAELPGLGERFEAAVNDVLERVCENPRQFPVVRAGLRRALLHGFPYALIFAMKSDDGITVVACFHGSRNPMHWHRRV